MGKACSQLAFSSSAVDMSLCFASCFLLAVLQGCFVRDNDNGQPGSSAGAAGSVPTLRDPAAAEAVAAATAGISAALAAGFMNKPESFHARCCRVPPADSSCTMSESRGNSSKFCSNKQGDCPHSTGCGSTLRGSAAFSTLDKGGRRDRQGDPEMSSNRTVPKLDTQQLFQRLSAAPVRGAKAEENPRWLLESGDRLQRHINERATSALPGPLLGVGRDLGASRQQRRGLVSALETRGTLRGDGNAARSFSPLAGSGDRGVSLRGVAAAGHDLVRSFRRATG